MNTEEFDITQLGELKFTDIESVTNMPSEEKLIENGAYDDEA